MISMEDQDFSDCSIIMINLDGLRKDRIQKCPTLRTIKEDNIYFSKMISVSPYTLAAHHSIFSGLYPSQNGVDAYYHMFRFKEDIKTFTEILKEKGYFTKADVISENIIPKRGFDEVGTFDEKSTDFGDRHSEIIKKISDKEKFFLFLHYEGVHSRLMADIMKKYDPKNNEDEYFENIEENNNRYDSYLKDCDKYVQAIKKTILEISKEKKIIVIWFADHGTSTGERKGEKFYGVYTYDYTINSFCMIEFPSKLNKVIDTQCSLLDFFPLMMNLSGGEQFNDKTLPGKNLIKLINSKERIEEEPIFVETGGLYGYWPSPKRHNIFCVRHNDLKLIYNDSNTSWEFYNLILDPKEKNNIYNETDLKIKELKEKLINFLNLNKIKNNLIKE
jgi:arylsulfatase A-like enzyme